MNKAVDQFVMNAKNWKAEFWFLRGVLLDCDLQEEFKWGKPCYTLNANNIVYFMDQDNFYIYSGGVRTMPCSVRAYVFEDFNSGQAYKIFATRNAQFNEVSWFYCSASSDEIDRYVTFNYLENIWSIEPQKMDLKETAGIQPILIIFPLLLEN